MQRRRGIIYVLTIAAIFVMFAVEVNAFDSSFHGYFESNFVLRDTTGIQNGFFEEAEGVQQRNTLKFDIDVYPDSMEAGPFSISKVHLTFRGAYDSIYDLRGNEYHDIRENMGASRFDYGKKDVKFESDLREAFVDFVYNGALGSAFFRPGRQLVSWGEASGTTTILDVINPKDQSYQLFFQNPDDVKTPLWMGRINYSMPRLTGFGLNFDLLWIPDIRPTQWGPLDGVAGNANAGFQAPYVSVTPFADLKGLSVYERVPTNENEYGGKVSAEIGTRFNISLLYFRDVVNDPSLSMTHFYSGRTAYLDHNKQHVYGGYFSYQLLALGMEAVIRGEVSRYTAYPISLATPERYGNWFNHPVAGWVPLDDAAGLRTYVYKPVTKTMLAIDKDLRLRWLSKDLTKVSLEWIHTTINEWENKLDDVYYDGTGRATGKVGGVTKDRRNIREQDSFLLQIMTYWWASKLNPTLLVAYNPGHHGEGATFMIKPSIKWYVTPQFYTDLRLQAFLGDSQASNGFANGIKTASEATIRVGYEW